MEIPSAGFVARPKETCSLREQSSPLRSEHESTPETGILSVQAVRAGVILAALIHVTTPAKAYMPLRGLWRALRRLAAAPQSTACTNSPPLRGERSEPHLSMPSTRHGAKRLFRLIYFLSYSIIFITITIPLSLFWNIVYGVFYNLGYINNHCYYWIHYI